MLNDPNMVTAAAMVGKSAIAASFAVLYVYTTELFPTVLRSGGMGLASFSSRMGGVLAPLVLLLPNKFPMLTFGACGFIAGVLILLLPETIGKPLPETIADCDERTVYVELRSIEDELEGASQPGLDGKETELSELDEAQELAMNE